jgi:glucose/arabinose dehydrogenase
MMMMRRRNFLQFGCGLTGGAGGWLMPTPVNAQSTQSQFAPLPTGDGGLRPRVLLDGLRNPWSIAFLPDGEALVTERPGTLRRLRLGAFGAADQRRVEGAGLGPGQGSIKILNVPRVHASGQGGLLDVVVSPDFERDELIWMSLAQPTDGGARTAIFRARLRGSELQQVEMIFAQKDDPRGQLHFGSRLVIDSDGFLFASLGERFFERSKAQSLENHFGKIIRIHTDGSIPNSNPFVNQSGALPEVWSFGHRNPQGAALNPLTGALWVHEHGPQGGDELNLVRAGKNYGWPQVTYGREYVTGFKIGEGTSRSDVEQPIHYWVPSIAPSGMAFVTSERYGALRGHLLVGSLKERCLALLELNGNQVVGEQRILSSMKSRIRDVRQGPDGYLYALTDSDEGAMVRLEPAPRNREAG